MNSASLIALDNGFRGAAVGLFLMCAIVRLRDRPNSIAARLSAALEICAIVYTIRGAPDFPPLRDWWSLPVAVIGWSATVVFWLWAQAIFDDEFELRRWHAVPWAAMVGMGLLANQDIPTWPALATIAGRAMPLAAVILALLAVAQTFVTWRADLVDRRRRLRIVVLIGALSYVIASPLVDLLMPLMAFSSLFVNFIDSLGLCVLVMVVGWSLLQAVERDQRAQPVPRFGDGFAQATPIVQAGEVRRPSVEPATLSRLERLMTVERTYRREGLTIGSLAALMSLPEYRLRQIINEGLGHRNFNAFLNHYRIDEAKTALTDASQRGVPVLTIAMDAGFQSLGPFNRAFKADTGQTPTEFRRLALAKAPSKPLSDAPIVGIGASR